MRTLLVRFEIEESEVDEDVSDELLLEEYIIRGKLDHFAYEILKE